MYSGKKYSFKKPSEEPEDWDKYDTEVEFRFGINVIYHNSRLNQRVIESV